MRLVKHLFLIGLGYSVAVIVASAVTIGLVVGIAALPDDGRFGSYMRVLADLPPIIVVGLLYTSIFGFPGWLLAVLFAQCRQLTRKAFFIATGAVNGLLAHFLFSAYSARSIAESYQFGGLSVIILWSVIGGLCGGWAYWRVAIVRLGRWRAM